MTRKEWYKRKHYREDLKAYREIKEDREKQDKETQLKAISKDIFRSNQITNYKDLEMKAISIWNNVNAINAARKEVKNITIDNESKIKLMLSKIEDVIKKVNRFNGLKSTAIYERISMNEIERTINDIVSDYNNVKNNEMISPYAKRQALQILVNRLDNVYKKLCKEYNV